MATFAQISVQIIKKSRIEDESVFFYCKVNQKRLNFFGGSGYAFFATSSRKPFFKKGLQQKKEKQLKFFCQLADIQDLKLTNAQIFEKEKQHFLKKQREWVLGSEKAYDLIHEEYKIQNKAEVEKFYSDFLINPLLEIWQEIKRTRPYLAPFKIWVSLKYPCSPDMTAEHIKNQFEERYRIIRRVDREFMGFFKINRQIRDNYVFIIIYRDVALNLAKLFFSLYLFNEIIPTSLNWIQITVIMPVYSLIPPTFRNGFIIIPVVALTWKSVECLKLYCNQENFTKEQKIKGLLVVASYVGVAGFFGTFFFQNTRLLVAIHLAFFSVQIFPAKLATGGK